MATPQELVQDFRSDLAGHLLALQESLVAHYERALHELQRAAPPRPASAPGPAPSAAAAPARPRSAPSVFAPPPGRRPAAAAAAAARAAADAVAAAAQAGERRAMAEAAAGDQDGEAAGPARYRSDMRDALEGNAELEKSSSSGSGASVDDAPYPPVGGRMHFWVPDHIVGSRVANDTPPGAHGHLKDACFQDGLERGIGHGRQHFPRADHIFNTASVEDDSWHEKLRRRRRHIGATDHIYAGASDDDPPGAHGHRRDSAFQGGMWRAIGNGRQHIPVQDHVAAGTAFGDPPGAHGHSKDDDYQDGGVQRGIGHGRRRLSSGLDALARAGPGRSQSVPGLSAKSAAVDAADAACAQEGLAAGRPTRAGVGFHPVW